MNGWKITAIIFICLFVIETATFIWIVKIGTEQINNENTCAVNICQNNNYDSYLLENNICYCYKNHEIAYKEVLK